jgi:hypothetical protein
MVRSFAIVAGAIAVWVMAGPGAAGTASHERLGVKLMMVDPGDLVAAATKDRLAEAFFAAYPPARARFNPAAPDTVVISFDPAYAGIALTAGATIICSATWANRHPLDADACGTHEFMHVAQGYGYIDAPSWAVEGLADYGRFKYGLFNAEEGWSLPPVTEAQSYSDGYRVTARFFVWLEGSHTRDDPQRARRRHQRPQLRSRLLDGADRAIDRRPVGRLQDATGDLSRCRRLHSARSWSSEVIGEDTSRPVAVLPRWARRGRHGPSWMRAAAG